MFSKINIVKILKDHFKTLKNTNTNKISLSDYFMFFILPLIFALIYYYFDITMSDDLIKSLLTIFSVFVGLLFNLLILIYDIVNKNNHKNKNEPHTNMPIRKKFLQEIFSNISFTIFMSIVIVILLLVTFTNNCFIKSASSLLSVYLMFLFILTLLMILKRIHVLLSKEFSEA
jgi:hypothetical protein